MTNHSKYIKYSVAHDSTDTRFPWILQADGRPLAAYINKELAFEALDSMKAAQTEARECGYYVVTVAGRASELIIAEWDGSTGCWSEAGDDCLFNDNRYSFIGPKVFPESLVMAASTGINTPSGTAAELVGA